MPTCTVCTLMPATQWLPRLANESDGGYIPLCDHCAPATTRCYGCHVPISGTPHHTLLVWSHPFAQAPQAIAFCSEGCVNHTDEQDHWIFCEDCDRTFPRVDPLTLLPNDLTPLGNDSVCAQCIILANLGRENRQPHLV